MMGIPGVLHTDENNNTRMIDLPTRLLTDRIVMVQGEITDELATSVVMQLRYLESQDKEKPVIMFIQSPGGSVSAGYAIIDTMHNIKCPVHTVAMGMTASMAVSIFINGKKGERTVYKHTELLVHQPSGGCKGQISDMEIDVKHGIKLKEQLAKEYSELTGVKLNKMIQMMDRDTILSAEEAKSLGFCDKIK
jgi:ATP-dependent Clp protease protease subunit